jgi:arylsulfatase
VAKKTLEHTTPILFPEDEDFDIGQDTRTGVAMLEYRYDVPFKFTGKINKLTFDLGHVQYTEAEHEQMQAIRDRVARAKD